MTTQPGLPPRIASVLDIALHRFLGVTLLDETDPRAGITFNVGQAALNNGGVLHGGIVTAMVDVACYLAILPDLADNENVVTHDLTVSLMRPVPAGSDVHVRGTVLRRGRAVVFLRAEAMVGDVVVAAGQVTKTVVTLRS
ncbi:MAG: PaaI family thioesterase [Actinobacteria bacterium]|nr:PaaI family thioesterase [Actinomycetota bacterium]MCA1720147.1 PaaI family thioesterase [Actinomycetota bacterium]